MSISGRAILVPGKCQFLYFQFDLNKDKSYSHPDICLRIFLASMPCYGEDFHYTKSNFHGKLIHIRNNKFLGQGGVQGFDLLTKPHENAIIYTCVSASSLRRDKLR